MATYVIGDLQGCFDPLQRLLDKLAYDPTKDQLWFVGDIVNRGPQSLECLRFVKQLGEQGKMVLGNHDVHLLACYAGLDHFRSKSDTLDPILQADDCDELMDWLRRQPLIVPHPTQRALMVHAGIPPQWTGEQALRYAHEVEQVLRSHQWREFITQHLFGSKTRHWHDQLQGWERLRYIVNALVRMRYCDGLGTLDFELKGSPKQHQHLIYHPWYSHPNRRNRDYDIYFGHWSTLGALDHHQIHALDTGCLWGGELTAYCLETQQRHTLRCQTYSQPKKKTGEKQK